MNQFQPEAESWHHRPKYFPRNRSHHDFSKSHTPDPAIMLPGLDTKFSHTEFAHRFGAELWNSVAHISNLETLRQHIVNAPCTWVAFDIEGKVTNINELGFASVKISQAKPLTVSEDGTLRSFYHQNKIQAQLIIARELDEKKRDEGVKYGAQMTVDRVQMAEYLSDLLPAAEQDAQDLVLVGYDLSLELK